MYIYLDPSEERSTSRARKALKDIPYTILPNLEALTGADMAISDLTDISHPAELLDDPCIRLIQIKFDFDAITSITDGRFKLSQAKMQNFLISPVSANIRLALVGNFSQTADGYVGINGQAKYGRKVTFDAFEASVMAWQDRGGVVDRVYGNRLPSYIKNLFRSIQRCQDEPVRRFYQKTEKHIPPGDTTPLSFAEFLNVAQKLEPVNDFRNILVAMPGLGPKKIDKVWEILDGGNFFHFLDLLTDGQLDKAIGPATVTKLIKHLSLEDV